MGLEGDVDHVFCALGTTIRKAGSRERFREVDYGLPLAVAGWTRAAGARHFSLVSSMGARTDAGAFYLRVKGAVEAALFHSGLPSLTRRSLRGSALILSYHNVIPDEDAGDDR